MKITQVVHRQGAWQVCVDYTYMITHATIHATIGTVVHRPGTQTGAY